MFEPHRYKIVYGGRGSAKSWSIARALLILALQRPLKILCARELQKSIQDSVHALLVSQAKAIGVDHLYRSQKASIVSHNGSEFIFSGLRTNADEIKSMEGIDIVWIEEAQSVSHDSWEILIPTIRKEGSEIWLSFNPADEKDSTYVRFVKDTPEGALLVEMNWRDNPWISAELLAEKDRLHRLDPEAAAHVWEGKTKKNSVAQVLRGRWRVESFEPQPGWDGPYHGADWGFASDPSVLVRVWVSGHVLYVEHEAWGLGVEINNLPVLFERVPDARQYAIRADSARPETISYVRQDHGEVKGYPNIVAAQKGPGSVEDGVEHLRSYEAIVIHPRCTHFAEEARLYSYKVDPRTGDVMPVIVDKHNNCMDAARYALEPIIKGKSLVFL